MDADTGLFYCQRCALKGDFQVLQTYFSPPDPFGEIYSNFHELSVRQLIKDEDARNYLFDRGFTEESITRFRYGYADEHVYKKMLEKFSKEEMVEAKLWIINEAKGQDFPYFKRRIIIPYMMGSRYSTFQGRAVDPDATKRYIFMRQSDPCLYHSEDINKLGQVWLTEGAFKRDSLAQNDAHAVGLPGASQFKRFLPELRRCKDLWICLDTDANEVGQRMALEITKGLASCTVVTLPLAAGQKKIGVDDFILEHGYDELLKIPGTKYEHGIAAKPTSLSILVADWREKVGNTSHQRGYQTGHERLDSWLEGYHPGSLTFLAGSSHHGKTAYMEDSAMRLHDRYENLTVEYYSNDDSLFLTIARWVAKIGRLQQKDVRYADSAYRDDPESMRRFEAAVKKLSMKADRLKILDRSYNVYLENLRDDLTKWREENPDGEKIVFIDAFTKTMTQKDDLFRGDTLGKAIYKSSLLKEMAQQAHIPIVCTTEVPKLAGKRPNSWNLKDSTTLEYDADVILLCYQEVHVKGISRSSLKIEYDDGTVNPVLEIIIGKDKMCGTDRKTDLFEIRRAESKFREVGDADYYALMNKVWESERAEYRN